MMANSQSLEAIHYKDGTLKVVDQLKLPLTIEYEAITGVEDGWRAIKQMKVRGAPCIAIVGCLSLAVELANYEPISKEDAVSFVSKQLDYLTTARPTAVNMRQAADKMKRIMGQLLKDENISAKDICQRVVLEAELMLETDVKCNKAMGLHGARHILANYSQGGQQRLMTHCNTGALATAGYGTALGVIRALHETGQVEHVYCTETRPYNQGARLTAFELVYEKIPASLITDSMTAFAMKEKHITAVIVGADRVVANGDTANKIGTYQLALCAKHHGVPFYVACTSTTCDFTLPSGDSILIEERPADEMTSINGIRIAAQGIGVWNPAFDVTPANLITGIITEFGVYEPSQLKEKLQPHISS